MSAEQLTPVLAPHEIVMGCIDLPQLPDECVWFCIGKSCSLVCGWKGKKGIKNSAREKDSSDNDTKGSRRHNEVSISIRT